jgi:hypothetical protein
MESAGSVEEFEAVCTGEQRGTTTPADEVFRSRLGLVVAVAIPSPSTQFKQYVQQ